MRTTRRYLPALLFLCAIGCNGEARAPLNAATLVLELPGPEELRRPGAFFNHGKHTEALKTEPCTTCHNPGKEEKLTFLFKRDNNSLDRDSLMNLYHDGCIGCHQESKEAAPLTCGECHRENINPTSVRVPLQFDYSLHGRHAKASKDALQAKSKEGTPGAASQGCEDCHHVYDEKAKKLVYVKDQEDACRTCHLDVPQKDTPALADAAHAKCVNCHKQKEGKTGPTTCVGCHEAKNLAAIEKMAEVPRLMRGQPDLMWVKTASGARGKQVAFNHLLHEGATDNCSTCHHNSLNPCSECHTLDGDQKGAQVTLETAYHHPLSRHSCVGCHNEESGSKNCAGCHQQVATKMNETTCTVCHAANHPDALVKNAALPEPKELVAQALPPYSADFPEEVTIDFLKSEYEASVLPHGKIVRALFGATKDSKLALAFHGDTKTLCAGCHHRAPPGTRPAQCRSCHGTESHPTMDKPDLKVAYHRQCLGCHQKMGLEAVGCTDCHAEQGKRAARSAPASSLRRHSPLPVGHVDGWLGAAQRPKDGGTK